MSTETLDRPADPIPCSRCPKQSLLCPGGLCADCIADIGLHHPEEHAQWLVQVKTRPEA